MNPSRRSPQLEQSSATTFHSSSPTGDAAHTKIDGAAGQSTGLIPDCLKKQSRYNIIRKLGSGGMGEVYLAEHTSMQRMVAIKVLRPGLIDDHELRRRFNNEVRAISRLSHPHVITAHDAQIEDGSDCYLVTEFVDGSDVAQRVSRPNEPLAVDQAVRWTIQAAEGLQHALDHGLVHRDIKPQNLLVTKDDVVKVGDFGLALVRDFDQTEGLTNSGTILGSVDYMSPEQASHASSADTRSDIYSLGCTLFYMLNGSPPFSGGSIIEKLQRHATAERPRLERRDIPEGLQAILRKMMDREPRQRYQQPREVAEALRPFAKPNMDSSSARPRSLFRWIAAGLVPIFVLAGFFLRLPFGEGELVIESDVEHVQVEVKQNNQLVEIIDTSTGTGIRLKPGMYDIAVRDTKNDQLSVSNNSVILKRGSKTIVKIKVVPKESATASASEPAVATPPPTVTAGRELDSVPKMPVNLSLYLKPYKLNEHGLVTVPGHHWSVSTAYRGIAADGKEVVDERLTLFISNADDSFSPAIVRLSKESATKLIDELTKQMNIEVARQELKDAMTVTLATQPYKLNENQVVHLAEENLSCEVLQAYVSVDENKQSATERRITLVLQDSKNSFWPLIVRMNDMLVKKLIDDLRSALKKSSAPAAQPPANPESYVGTFQDTQGRKLEIKQDGSQLTYAIYWGPNGPVSRGQLVQTAEGDLQFQQPGDITPITVKLDADKKSVSTISLLKLDFVRQ